MRNKRHRAITWIVAGILVAIAMTAFFGGTRLGGLAPVQSQCSQSADVPTKGGPYYEGTVVTGAVTYFPLGVICTYDVAGDGIGPQTVAHQNWAETIVSALAIIAALFATLIATDVIPARNRGSQEA